jgi:trans-feruloyl-CoA hydratase/vanillin synthase
MSYSTIKIDIEDGVGLLTLNRPEKRNAMSPELTLEVVDALEKLRYDDAARVVVITGAGEAFCGGMDLKEHFTALKDTPAEYDRITRASTEWRGRTLRYYPKPTIAMINGYCFGGAFSIVEGCDLAFAADDATFGLSEINFKIFPGGAVSKSLANLLRPRDALFYGLTGRPFDGRTAADIGLVNFSFPAAELREQTFAIARELGGKDPHALQMAKEAYRHSLDMGWEAAVDFAMAKEAELSMLQQNAWREEGIGDFLAGKYRPGLEGHEAQAPDAAAKA